jgi:hypothetical protein
MDPGLVINLIVAVIGGVITAIIARHKGRNIVGWFIFGFFLPLIAIIVVAVLPNLNEQRARSTRQIIEQRRLREQLRQERMKNEMFRRHAAERLDRHDSALGLDTRQTALQNPGGPQAALPGVGPAISNCGHAGNPGPPAAANPGAVAQQQRQPQPFGPTPQAEQVPRWYYEHGGQAVGPVTEDTIRQKLLQTGELESHTLVWSEDLGQWTPVGEVPLFRMEAGW